ncbi:MAG: energy-coupled thiamine transporter ThiT [Candidatus Bathyarchaeota archaeon]|jgi:thiamine transporter|nr:energy-coupled thiamine transporter ThiT [Candidatus Bathyarchaeota archaeon A05DMB-5]MDH7558576.1 energy-coupled thiamine transporter ThiT [Candidatus Bathyarchaeota archaeon]
MKESKATSSTKIIAEVVSFVALATALSYIKVFSFPEGGSVTAGSMVPILWLALRRGAKVGLFAAVVYGLVQLAVEPFIYHPAQVLLDYPIAFGMLGLAGFFQNRPFVGVNVGIWGRFLAHFISGVIFFGSYAPEGMSPIVYSAFYNGGYILPELAISIYIIYLLQESKLLKIFL